MAKINNKKFAFGLVGILTAIALLAFGGGYFLWRFLLGEELTPLDGAKLVPKDTLMTAFISTDSQDWLKLSQFNTSASGSQNYSSLITDRLQKLIAQSFPDVNYQDDIESWLGGVMLAVLPSDKQKTTQENLLVVLGIENKFKAWQFLNKIKKNESNKIEESDYKGTTIIETKSVTGDTFSSALLNDRLVISSQKEAVEQAIDIFYNRESLAAEIKDTSLLVNRQSIAQIYIPKYSNFVDYKDSLLTNNSLLANTNFENLKTVDSLNIDISNEKQGIRIQAIAKLKENLNSDSVQSNSHKIVSQFPSDTVALLGGQGIGQTWSYLKDALDRDSQTSSLVKIGRGAFKAIDLDLDKDLFGWMNGNFAIGIFNSDSGFLSSLGFGGAIILETTDRPKAENTLNKLAGVAISKANYWILLEEKNIENIKISELNTFQKETILSYGWLDKNSLLITLGTPFNKIIDTKNRASLKNNQAFDRVMKDLPSNSVGYAYIDVQQSLNILDKLSKLSKRGLDPQLRQTLASIEGIGIKNFMPDNLTSKFDMFLTLKNANNEVAENQANTTVRLP
jgi:hypothetical protein